MIRARQLVVPGRARPRAGPIDLDVAAGALVALVGPNGSGKSSLLGALAGVVPSTGELTVGAIDPRAVPRAASAQVVSLLAQGGPVEFAHPCVEVAAASRAARASWFAGIGDADRADALVALERLGVGDLASRPITAVSGGERQRVLLAAVLLQQAPVVLLDEPTSAQDYLGASLVLHAARQEASAGRAVVVALHDLNLLPRFDRAIVLDAGRIRLDAPPDEVLSSAVLDDVWGGGLERHPSGDRVFVLPRGR